MDIIYNNDILMISSPQSEPTCSFPMTPFQSLHISIQQYYCQKNEWFNCITWGELKLNKTNEWMNVLICKIDSLLAQLTLTRDIDNPLLWLQEIHLWLQKYTTWSVFRVCILISIICNSSEKSTSIQNTNKHKNNRTNFKAAIIVRDPLCLFIIITPTGHLNSSSL